MTRKTSEIANDKIQRKERKTHLYAVVKPNKNDTRVALFLFKIIISYKREKCKQERKNSDEEVSEI